MGLESVCVCVLVVLSEIVCRRNLRSSAIPLLVQSFIRTDFSWHAFRFSTISLELAATNSSDQ